MDNIRLIARLDVKAPNLVKGVQLEGLRKLGDPNEFAKKYYDQGIDEILYIDIVASLYERNSLLDIVRKTTAEVFVPITVGGGLRTIDDVTAVLNSGADKIAINTAALKRPELINEVAKRFGSQCVVLSIQAKQNGQGTWEAYYDNGREHSGRDVIEWAQQGADMGAGEILLTSVDREGTTKGFDLEVIKEVSQAVSIPIIAGGGMGILSDIDSAVHNGANAVAMAHMLHYNQVAVNDVRQHALSQQLNVREIRQ